MWGKQKEIPYPDGYYVPKKEETETAGKSDKSQKNASETAKETTRETIQARAGSETENKKISFYLDTSGSMQRSPEVVKIHAAATKCAAGYEERHFYSVDSRNLIETTEQLALSGQYGSGAAIDLIRDGTLPCDPEGVNVLTTDLQTGTSCSEIGKWLVNTGATGYSFYVFTMQYNGSLQFKMYTSSSVLETVSVKDCSFAQKEFLMIVFGKNSLVEDYDQFFQYKLGTEVPYDTCHVSLHAEKKQEDHFLQLTSQMSPTTILIMCLACLSLIRKIPNLPVRIRLYTKRAGTRQARQRKQSKQSCMQCRIRQFRLLKSQRLRRLWNMTKNPGHTKRAM